MKERIQEFIDYKGVSPGDLALALGVQRSNISHILNGRNKPGAAFIEKFLLVYPEVNARWLLTGKGDMQNEETTQNKTVHPASNNKIESEPVVKNNISNDSSNKSKSIKKVVLLYSDGSFEVFRD